MATIPLLAWLDEPHPGHGVRFAADDGWEAWSYPELAAFAGRVAHGLLRAGVGTGDRVLIVHRSGPEFAATLFGVMAAGAVPCPVAPPLLFHDAQRYATHVQAVAHAAGPVAAVTLPELREPFLALLADSGIRVTTVDDLVSGIEDTAGLPPAKRAETALVQFTSGSSGTVRGVAVPFASLEANVAAIRAWLAMTPEDPTASWLPIHHDMGLIGCLLTPVVNQSDLYLLGPEWFIRDPARYLRCFDRGPSAPGARLTALPNFGLEHITRRVKPEALAGLDLSEWRAVIVGAERVDAAVLDRFAALLEPCGFDRRALLPAYGIAEATLAVTGLALDVEFGTAAVDARTLAVGSSVAPSLGGSGDSLQQVVGCGRPLTGVEVEVVDDEGVPLPEDRLGEIVVRGTSLTAGYVAAAGTGSPTRFEDGALYTGDAGFLRDGQLYVIGRLGDSVKVRGRTVFAEDVEAALVAEGIPRTRLAVLLGASAQGATAVVVIEQGEPEWLAGARKVVRRVAEGSAGVVLDVPRRTIQRTTSGKPRRRVMWRAYVDGELPGAVVPTGS